MSSIHIEMEKDKESPDDVEGPCAGQPIPSNENNKNEILIRADLDRKREGQTPLNKPLPDSSQIDKQLTDLENLIRRLQDEIVELSANPTQNPSLVDTVAIDEKNNSPTKGEHTHDTKMFDVDKDYQMFIEESNNSPKNENTNAKAQNESLRESEDVALNMCKTTIINEFNLNSCSETTSETIPTVLYPVQECAVLKNHQEVITAIESTGQEEVLVSLGTKKKFNDDENMVATILADVHDIQNHVTDSISHREYDADEDEIDCKPDIKLYYIDYKSADDDNPIQRQIEENRRKSQNDEYHMQQAIKDLKSDISEQLESVKDININKKFSIHSKPSTTSGGSKHSTIKPNLILGPD